MLLILSLLDATLTTINIHHWGMDVEWNPMMRTLIEKYGIWIMYAEKLFFGILLLVLLIKVPENRLRRWITPILMWLVGVYSVIVFYGYVLATS